MNLDRGPGFPGLSARGRNTLRSNAPAMPDTYTSAHSDFVADLAQRGRGDETYVTVKLHIGSRHRCVHRHGRPDSGIERRSACRCRTKERPPDALRAWCPIAGGGRSWVTLVACRGLPQPQRTIGSATTWPPASSTRVVQRSPHRAARPSRTTSAVHHDTCTHRHAYARDRRHRP